MAEEKKELQGIPKEIEVQGMVIECPQCKTKIEVKFTLELEQIIPQIQDILKAAELPAEAKE